MKLQLSIRTALVALAVFAVIAAWYAKNAATRARELRALARIESLTQGRTSVADTTTAGCGSWSGGLIHTEQVAPAPVRWLNLDAFRRVTHVAFQDERNPDLVVALNAFEELRSISFSNGTTSPLSRRSQSDAELAGALYLFRSLHAGADVWYDDSETTAYQVSQSSFDDPFGVLADSDADSLTAGNAPSAVGSVAHEKPFGGDDLFE